MLNFINTNTISVAAILAALYSTYKSNVTALKIANNAIEHANEKQEELFKNEKEKELKKSRPLIYNSEENKLKFWIPSANPLLNTTIFFSSMESLTTLGDFRDVIQHGEEIVIDQLFTEEYILIQYTTSELEIRFSMYFPIFKTTLDIKYNEEHSKNLEALLTEAKLSQNPNTILLNEDYLRSLWESTSYVKNIPKDILLQRDLSSKDLFSTLKYLRMGNSKEALITLFRAFTDNAKYITMCNFDDMSRLLSLHEVYFSLEKAGINNLLEGDTPVEKEFFKKWNSIFHSSVEKIDLNDYFRDIMLVLSKGESKNVQHWMKIPIYILSNSSGQYFYTEHLDVLIRLMLGRSKSIRKNNN